jgi:hypothetical protein
MSRPVTVTPERREAKARYRAAHPERVCELCRLSFGCAIVHYERW